MRTVGLGLFTLAALASSPTLAQSGITAADVERALAEGDAAGAYAAFATLEAQGVELDAEAWRNGARAALVVGDVAAGRARWERAQELQPVAEGREKLDELALGYGEVVLAGGKAVSADVTPFLPEPRQAILFANARLREAGGFQGLLPVGSYSVDGRPFTVTAGGTVRVEGAAPSRAGAGGGGSADGLAYVGPRVTVAGGVTWAREAAGLAEGEAPPAFAGPGLRGAVGLEVGLGQHVGIFGEVGYHGLTARVDRTDAAEIEELSGLYVGNLLRLGTVGVGLSARAGRLAAGLGPLVAVGVAQAVNPDEADVDHLVWTTGGAMVLGGGQVDLALRLASLGAGRHLAVVGSGGVLADGQRPYPFAQLGLRLAPSAD